MRDNYKRCYAFCLSRRDGHDDTDDIVSEAFMRLYEKWPDLPEHTDEYMIQWMYRAISLIIHKYKNNDPEHETVNLDDCARTLATGNDEDKTFRYNDLIETLEKDMTPSEKKLFRLAFLEKYSYPELCGIFGIKDQALRARISKLKARMKRTIMKKVYPVRNNKLYF